MTSPHRDAHLRIAVLMGGANSERHTSLATGAAIARALRDAGQAVATVDSTEAPAGADREPRDAFLTAEEAVEHDADEVPDESVAVTPPDLDVLAEMRARQEHGVLVPGLLPILQAADAVLVTVFGDEGESGATQRFLAAHDLVYTGPTPEVCELTFDKARTKEVLAAHRIDTPAWHVVRRGRLDEDLAALTIPGPWIVKPVAGGSTLGLSKVDDEEELPAACEKAEAEERDALVEAYAPGRDFTIAVLGDRVFPAVESVTDHEVLDYEAKYAPGEARKEVPADLSPEQTAEVRRLSGEVHRILGIGDTTSRADFRRCEDGRFTFLETNPLPGLTPTSSYRESVEAEGMSLPELCEEIVGRARRRSDRSGT